MKRINWKFMVTACVGATMTFTSCEDTAKEENHDTPDKKEVSNDDTDNPNTDIENLEDELVYDPNVYYQVPTPNELFMVLKDVEMSFDDISMNPVENKEKYNDAVSQSLNLGVYFADMAMDGTFNDGKNTIKYLKSVLGLGEDLNISGAFDEALIEKITNSSTNSDELVKISNDTYFDAYSYLEENQRGATLSMIIIGGWVESLYLMAESGTFVEGNEFSKRMAEQKLTMENLMGYLMKYQDDKNVSEIMSEMAPLDEFFMNLEVIEGDAVTTDSQDGVYVLTGGSEISMSASDFTEFKSLIGALRTDIINAEL